jgi:dephospho-CoA kinase
MQTIGLTGGIASGKSTVAKILTDLGFEVQSADQIARQVVEPGLPAYQRIIAEFGPAIRLAGGRLDREQLAQLVFGDAVLRQKLEQIIHPEVIARIKTVITVRQATGQPFLFVEVPLLFETGLEKMFDLVWVVNLTEANQLQRLLGRDQLSAVAARRRMAAQLSLAEKAARADWVIENNGDLAELQEQVRKAVKLLRHEA